MKSLQLAISTLLFFSAIGETQAQTTLYKANYYINGEKAQDQYYQVQRENGTMKIQERGVFLSNTDIYAYAESISDSIGYRSVEIAFNNGTINSLVQIIRSERKSKLYYSYFNNELVDSISTNDSTIILFDGPNPSFDALNAMLLAGKKGQEVELVLINWINGSLSSEKAYYIIGKEEIAVHKQETKRVSFLSFAKNGILPKTCYQGKESYEFENINVLPVKLKIPN